MNEPLEPRPVSLRTPLVRWPPRGLPPVVDDDPELTVPPAVLQRFNARLLDPATSVKRAGSRFRSTVYLGDRLMIRGSLTDEARRLLEAAAAENTLVLVPVASAERRRAALLALAKESRRDDAERLFPAVIGLQPAPGSAVDVDAWRVLQTFRAMAGDAVAGTADVGVEHLLAVQKRVYWTPFPGDEGAGRRASASFADPGFGGRAPVQWVGPRPLRRGDKEVGCRRPVVAVLDTGIGDHFWWRDVPGLILADDGQPPIGLPASGDEPERTGVTDQPLEGGLDDIAGHGTFIAGLIHQICPDAAILPIRVAPGSGYAPESVVLDALGALVCRQQRAVAGDPALAVDVVSLSLGHYDEHDAAPGTEPFLWHPIQELGRLGVAVVASAGNDATSRPMVPAAFAPHAGGLVETPATDCVPVTSVGALNPNGSTALFSNAGPWVSTRRPGAALVSTFPQSFDAAGQPSYSARDGSEQRATLDPDDFAAGFGTWSGTSFAGPVLAGQLAQAVLASGTSDQLDVGSCVARGAAAVQSVLGATP